MKACRNLILKVLAVFVLFAATVPAAPILVTFSAVSAVTLSASSAEAQSKKEQRVAAAALPPETTYAIVNMMDRRFEDALGQPDPDFITATLEIDFNGTSSGTISVSVTHAVGASKSQVQTAVRQKVNEWLNEYEPGNSLNNAHIILGGLSD